MYKQTVALVFLASIGLPVMAEININRVPIAAPISFVYDYITQPDRWHDWYPHSNRRKHREGH
ncbi:MAG: hypothetical protein AseanaTS_28820 [Candidatus Pelagadaptatus aseana]